MKHYFKVRGFVPEGIIINGDKDKLDLRDIPPLLRMLLITDGTVTKSLEAYFWERVIVETIEQKPLNLDKDNYWLDAKAHEQVLNREIRLIGEQSGHIYAYANSLLRLEEIESDLREQLLSGKIGIGELLREKGLETYREIVDMGRNSSPSITNTLEIPEHSEYVYRTYRIISHHKPSILITENFPFDLYIQPT